MILPLTKPYLESLSLSPLLLIPSLFSFWEKKKKKSKRKMKCFTKIIFLTGNFNYNPFTVESYKLVLKSFYN